MPRTCWGCLLLLWCRTSYYRYLCFFNWILCLLICSCEMCAFFWFSCLFFTRTSALNMCQCSRYVVYDNELSSYNASAIQSTFLSYMYRRQKCASSQMTNEHCTCTCRFTLFSTSQLWFRHYFQISIVQGDEARNTKRIIIGIDCQEAHYIQ